MPFWPILGSPVAIRGGKKAQLPGPNFRTTLAASCLG